MFFATPFSSAGGEIMKMIEYQTIRNDEPMELEYRWMVLLEGDVSYLL